MIFSIMKKQNETELTKKTLDEQVSLIKEVRLSNKRKQIEMERHNVSKALKAVGDQDSQALAQREVVRQKLNEEWGKQTAEIKMKSKVSFSIED